MKREEREEREREKKTHTKSSAKYIYANGTSTILNYSIIIIKYLKFKSQKICVV